MQHVYNWVCRGALLSSTVSVCMVREMSSIEIYLIIVMCRLVQWLCKWKLSSSNIDWNGVGRWGLSQNRYI